MNTRTVFPSTKVRLANTTEEVVVGGRDKFPLLSAALEGIRVVGSIGWGSQGPAQATNFDETLEAVPGIKLMVGLRQDSPSFADAEEKGFMVSTGTAGEMYDVIKKSDLVLMLIKDAAQVENLQRIQAAMKPGATLGFSHGFLPEYMRITGTPFRGDINVIGVFPKGMGPSVRRLYEQGREINGAGINCSYAVEQDVTGTARNVALAWAVAIGAPWVLETTMHMECLSDLVGERGVLLGGVWGPLEALFNHFVSQMSEEDAFAESAISLTGAISQTISKRGLIGVVEALRPERQGEFFRALNATYLPAKALLEEIYAEVASGREIMSVVDATARLDEYPFSKVDGARMWQVGKKVRAMNPQVDINPIVAGVYIGVMMAQIDVFRAKGHSESEIANETVIESVDSLNPFMHARGVAHMVDNCSTTARLGTRKWGPRFLQMVSADALPRLDESSMAGDWFMNHSIHQTLAECMKMRPPVDISVT